MAFVPEGKAVCIRGGTRGSPRPASWGLETPQRPGPAGGPGRAPQSSPTRGMMTGAGSGARQLQCPQGPQRDASQVRREHREWPFRPLTAATAQVHVRLPLLPLHSSSRLVSCSAQRRGQQMLWSAGRGLRDLGQLRSHWSRGDLSWEQTESPLPRSERESVAPQRPGLPAARSPSVLTLIAGHGQWPCQLTAEGGTAARRSALTASPRALSTPAPDLGQRPDRTPKPTSLCSSGAQTAARDPRTQDVFLERGGVERLRPPHWRGSPFSKAQCPRVISRVSTSRSVNRCLNMITKLF